MTTLASILADLAVEWEELRALLAPLPEEGWRTPTPAVGWDVATQIAHLAWTDETAAVAAASVDGSGDPAKQAAWEAVVALVLTDPDGFIDTAARAEAAAAPTDILARWDSSRPALVAALTAVPDGVRMPWFGPPMVPASMATARIMETWAHGLDVRAALGVTPVPSDRVRHVCHIGVRTRDFAYLVHGETAPTEPFRVELTAPSGAVWGWGPEEAAQRVTGPGWDFALLATQRAHLDDTALRAVGDDAAHWLTIAQAFAGPPGGGRAPGEESS
jgi:uncharacterized protein (TIGR03084 family)